MGYGSLWCGVVWSSAALRVGALRVLCVCWSAARLHALQAGLHLVFSPLRTAGDYVVRAGEMGDKMYFIRSGKCKVLIAGTEGSTSAGYTTSTGKVSGAPCVLCDPLPPRFELPVPSFCSG